jgi:hypothetical protein
MAAFGHVPSALPTKQYLTSTACSNVIVTDVLCSAIAFLNSYYGCETWSLTLREERRLRVFENKVLRRIFGPRWDEVTGEWRRLHNEEINDLYFSPNIMWVIKSRRMRCTGYVARMGEERGVYRVLVGKPKGKNHWGDLGVDGWKIL